MSIVADDFDQICLPLGDRSVWTLGFRSLLVYSIKFIEKEPDLYKHLLHTW